MQQAERRLSLARAAYEAGVTSRIELLDAQRTVYGARMAMLNTRHAELASAMARRRSIARSGVECDERT